MKKLFAALAAISALSAFGLFLYTAMNAMKKTLMKSITMTSEETALIEKLGEPKWTDYFFSYLTLFMLLLLGVFLVLVFMKGRQTFAPAACHIVSLGAIVMVMLCLKTVLDGKIAILYNQTVMYAVLILTLFSYAFLMLYSSMELTAKEFKRYL